jgi:hypothetical protein
MTVGHSAITADFFYMMDTDPGTGVILRIGGRPAVCDLVLFSAGQRRERRVVPERLLRVP